MQAGYQPEIDNTRVPVDGLGARMHVSHVSTPTGHLSPA
jgi:hypothetical protein